MKTRLLQRYGIPGCYWWQHFPAKECRHCTGRRRWFCDECEILGKCCRCDGSHIYAQEAWVRLIEWRLGRYLFHCPAERVYEPPSGRVRFEGKVRHNLMPYRLPDESRMWLELFFDTKWFFANLGRNAFYGKMSFKRPLVSLDTMVHTLRFNR